ncbi:MAG: hypothetical protein EHM49_01175, partial [Deltaproteobacteria bacterium]
MIQLDFKDPFASPETEEEGFLSSQVPDPDFGRGPAIDLDRGAPKATPKLSIDFEDPFAPKKTEAEVDWSAIRSPEELRKEWEGKQPQPPTMAIPDAETRREIRRIQVPQATTMPQRIDKEEGWLPVLGKSFMGGFGRPTTGVTGAGAAEMEIKTDVLADIMKLSPEEKAEMEKKREVALAPVEDLSNIVTDYWTPMVGQNKAKEYVSGILSSTVQSAATMLTGGAGLPLFGITSGGEKYREMRKAGYSPLKSAAVAIPVGVSEAATEILPFKFLKGILGRAGGKAFKNALGYYGSEVSGELINTSIEDALDKVTTRPDMTFGEYLSDLWDTVVVTTGQTLLMGGVGRLATRGERKAKRQAQNLQKLISEAQARMAARQGRALPEEALTLGEEQPIIDRAEEVSQESKKEVGVEPIPEELTKPEEKQPFGEEPPPEEPPPVVTKEPEPGPKGPPPQALNIEEEAREATDEDLRRIREELLEKQEGEEPAQKIPGIPPQGEKTPPPPRPVPPSLQELVGKKDVDSIIRRGGGMEWGINGFYL